MFCIKQDEYGKLETISFYDIKVKDILKIIKNTNAYKIKIFIKEN